MAELWFGQTGVVLSQHTDEDDRFPGWQESFGEGTFQADYTSDGRFPNDDASHISVADGFKATLVQNSYREGNQGPNDLEETFVGPADENLTDFGLNDEVSELIVEKLPDSDNNRGGISASDLVNPKYPYGQSPIKDITRSPRPSSNDELISQIDDLEEQLEAGMGGGQDNKTLMYIIGGVVVLGLGYMLMKNK